MQEDHVLPYLSVMESMDGAADLKLGDKVAKSDKKAVVSISSLYLYSSSKWRLISDQRHLK